MIQTGQEVAASVYGAVGVGDLSDDLRLAAAGRNSLLLHGLCTEHQVSCTEHQVSCSIV